MRPNNHYIKTLALLVLCLLLFACANSNKQSVSQSKQVIIYSSNLNGELEPCGCSETGNLGGIKRRSTLIKQLRVQYPNLLLLSGGGLLISDAERDRLKSEYILKGLQEIKYDLVGVQWRDLAYGHTFLNKHDLPWVSSNWLGNDFKHSRAIIKSGVQYKFYSWLEPSASPWRKMQNKKRVVADSFEKLLNKIKQEKTEGSISILASNLPWQDLKHNSLAHVDIIIIKANHEKFIAPRQEGRSLILQAGSRGMRLGKLEFHLDKSGKIIEWQHQELAMGKDTKDDPELAAWYQEYNDEVKKAYLARVEKKKLFKQGKSPFASELVCQSCHKKAHDIWSQSKHAKAFSVLEKVNKAFDPDCIVCHTLGFEMPGGYMDMRSTPDFINVQCENCHGAAKVHADSGGKIKPKPIVGDKSKVCEQCHNQSHSPDFDFKRYWGKISHGR